MGLWMATGCYHPTIPSGAPCETSDDCPTSQACVASVCGGTEVTVDGPAGGDASPDAADDAAVDAPVDAPIDAAILQVVIGDDPDELRDTTLQGAVPNQGFGAQGHMSVDDSEPSLVWFDLTAIPTTRTVVSATLSVPVADQASEAGGLVQLHRLRERWVEMEATWLSRTATLTWSTSGARAPAIDPTPVASFSPAAVATRYDVVLPPALVQAWIADPAANFGILFNEGTAPEHVHLGTRESASWCRLTLELY